MKAWRELRHLPAEVFVLAATTLVNRTGTMVLPFLVLYLTRGLGFRPGEAGLILAFYGAAAVLAAPLSGRLTDRVGPRRILQVSLTASGATLLVFPLAQSFAAVASLTIVFALTNELYRPAALAVVSDFVPPERRKPAFALHRLALNLGMSVGPAVGGFLAQVSFPALFLVDGVTSLAAATLLALAPWRPHVARHDTERSGAAGNAFRDSRLVYFLLAIFPVALVFFQHASSMALFLVRNLSLPESTYGLMFTLNTLLIVLLEVPLNGATAAWPHRRSLALGALLTGAGFGALALAKGALGVAATVVVWTFGEMVLLPAMAAYVADISPPERRGEYMGAYTMVFSLAFGAAPALGTFALERFGPTLLWTGALALGLVSMALLARVTQPLEDAHPHLDSIPASGGSESKITG